MYNLKNNYNCSLKNLEITSNKNAKLRTLKYICLRESTLLETLVLEDMPKLEHIRFIGGKEVNNKLTSFKCKNLPKLETVYFKDFVNLRGTNDRDDTFKFHYYYQYPSIRYLHLENLGITDLMIEPMNTISTIELVNNSKLTYMYLDNVNLSSLKFNKETFPNLTGLTLKHLPETCPNTLEVSDYDDLEGIFVQKCPSIKKLKIKDLPKLSSIMCSDCSLDDVSGLDKSLVSLKRISFGGNLLKSCNLSYIPTLVHVDLSSNYITSSDDFDFSVALKDIKLTGNEDIDNVDLTKYTELERVVISGYKRDGSGYIPGGAKLKTIKFPSSDYMYSISLGGNSIQNIFENAPKFPSLESIDLSANELTPLGLANLLGACRDSEINFNRTDEFDISDLRYFKVDVKDGKTIDFSDALRRFKEVEEEGTELFGITVYLEDDETELDRSQYDFNKETGILTINKPGNYYIGIDISDGYLARAFMFLVYESQKVTIK